MEDNLKETGKSGDSLIGNIKINSNVINELIGMSINNLGNDIQMRGNFFDKVLERFGKRRLSKGIKVELASDKINIYINGLIRKTSALKSIQKNIPIILINQIQMNPQKILVNISGVRHKLKVNSPVEDGESKDFQAEFKENSFELAPYYTDIHSIEKLIVDTVQNIKGISHVEYDVFHSMGLKNIVILNKNKKEAYIDLGIQTEAKDNIYKTASIVQATVYKLLKEKTDLNVKRIDIYVRGITSKVVL